MNTQFHKFSRVLRKLVVGFASFTGEVARACSIFNPHVVNDILNGGLFFVGVYAAL